jgi:hypothetical protein
MGLNGGRTMKHSKTLRYDFWRWLLGGGSGNTGSGG